MPAVRLAEEGFVVPASLARELNTQVAGAMKPFPASVTAYGKPGGGEWAAGTVWCWPISARPFGPSPAKALTCSTTGGLPIASPMT